MIKFFVTAGGIFAILTFVHFFGDWLFQSQYEATNKSKNAKVRAIHCTIYTAFFLPVLFAFGLTTWTFIACVVILWGSHFIIDTYIPVLLWLKYLRRNPEINGKKVVPGISTKNTTEIFVWLWEQPVYPILFIAVDQILHLTCLWPVVFLIIL